MGKWLDTGMIKHLMNEWMQGRRIKQM